MNIEYKILEDGLYDSFETQTSGSGGFDLRASEDCYLNCGEVKKVKTGVAVWLGSKRTQKSKWEFYNSPLVTVCALVLPRSGLSTNRGIMVTNSPGLIDEDYQGEIIVSLWNREVETMSSYGYEIKKGDRIAQLVFTMCLTPKMSIVDKFSGVTNRCRNGFGSTGV